MITEKGAIKVTTAISENMQKEFSVRLLITSIVLIVLGALGVAVFLSLEITAIFLEWSGETRLIVMALLCAVVLGLGIACLRLLRKGNREVKGSEYVNVYEFYSYYFILTQIKNGEKVGAAKIYNDQIKKAKETKNYIFFYLNNLAAYPVVKSGLSEAELNTLRSLFKLPVKGGTVELPSEPVMENSINTDNEDITNTENANAENTNTGNTADGQDDVFGEFKS